MSSKMSQAHKFPYLLSSELPKVCLAPCCTRSSVDIVRAHYVATIAAGSFRPNMPRIMVKNNIDSEPVLSMPHYYSDEMWHGTDVPPPTPWTGGCACADGSCVQNPCCIYKQYQMSFSAPAGLTTFLYMPAGHLWSYEGIPIFECHSGCACGDSCANRVSKNPLHPFLSCLIQGDIQVVQCGTILDITITKFCGKGWGESCSQSSMHCHSHLYRCCLLWP